MKRPPAPKILSLVARNAVPVAGILLFGWNAQYLVLLYFLDSIVSFAALAVWDGITTGNAPPGTWPAGSRPPGEDSHGFLGIALAFLFAAGLFAIIGGLPVVLLIDVSKAIRDPWLLLGAGAQLAAAAQALVITRREVRGLRKRDLKETIAGRMLFVSVRWLATLIAGEYLAHAFLMVVAYAAASVYFELYPPSLE